MQGKSDLIHIKRKTLLFLFIAFLVLGIATPVLADYLGPDRTTTESYTDTYDYGVWARDNNRIPYCLDKRGNKADDCIVCEWERRPGNACGDATYWYTLGTISEVVETTVSLPPATISSSLQNCSLNNSWCNTASELSLNGTEPLSGYNILAIEGSLNGQPFACSGSNCNVSLNEGNNDLSFWALSSYGDSSTMGTNSAKVDTVSPSVGLDLSGSSGTNGWFVSLTTITATGSDATSGLLSALLSVNSGPWESSSILSEGVHNISVQAEDNAGNTANSSTTISVDTITPTIDVSVNGTLDSNGWYSTSMEGIAVANDATSGVASLESSLDGGVYQAYISPVSFADGYHTIQFKAVDKAGNETETSVQEFYVDAIAPAIDLPAEWEVNDTITYKVQDEGSGLAALRIVIEDEDEKFAKVAWDEAVSGNKFKGEITWNGKFKDGTVAPPGEYLVWVKVTDVAGNEHIGLGRVVVPQPFASFSLIQPSKSSTEIPTPPADLFDSEDSSQAPENSNADPSTSPSTSFGGSPSQTNSTTVQSLTLTSGSSSASSTAPSNVLWGAAAAAMLGAATAYALEEQRKRKEVEARLQEDGTARKRANTASHRADRDEEPPLTRHEKELAKKRKELQKLWDANGAAIYAANREYKAKHGKEMDAASRSKAIKDATMNGVFHAKAYVSNLEAEKARQEARNERMANQMTRFEKEEEARWQAQQKAAEEKRKAEELRAGYAAYYAAMRQGEQGVESNWWDSAKERFSQTISGGRNWANRVMGAIPNGWRGFLLSPLNVARQEKGSNLAVSVNQSKLNIVSSVTNWLNDKLPSWLQVSDISKSKTEYYDFLAEAGLDINPTGNLSPKKWTDRLLDIVLGRSSATLTKEATEEVTQSSLRNTLKAMSPGFIDGLIEGAFNAYDYILGDKKNETDKFQKWLVSSGVDTGGSLLTGAAAALTVAGIVAGIGYVLGAPVTVPATLIVISVIVIGAIFDIVLESTGVKDVVNYHRHRRWL